MGKINKWSPGELIALGIMGAIICFALGVAILVIGVFNDLFSYWMTSSYWYVKALAILCYLGEICIAVGLLISIRVERGRTLKMYGRARMESSLHV